jgi:hypothetical protein
MNILAQIIKLLALTFAAAAGLLLLGVVIFGFTNSTGEGFSKLGELLTNPLVLVYFAPAILLYGLADWLKRK